MDNGLCHGRWNQTNLLHLHPQTETVKKFIHTSLEPDIPFRYSDLIVMKNERFLVKCHGKREMAKRVPAVYRAMEIAIWGIKNSPSIFGKATVNRRFSLFNIHVICSKPVSFLIYDSRGGAQESTGQPTSVFKIGPFKRP